MFSGGVCGLSSSVQARRKKQRNGGYIRRDLRPKSYYLIQYFSDIPYDGIILLLAKRNIKKDSNPLARGG